MTNHAVITKAGALRLLRPELEGQIVEYARLHDHFSVAQHVTLDGQIISPALSYKEPSDDQPSLELLDDAMIVRSVDTENTDVQATL